MTRAACIEELAAAVAALTLGHPTRLAIDGVDGVGKTTLANEIVEPLVRMGRQVVRASIDGFHRPRDVRYQRGADSAEGYFLDSFDYGALRSELLDPLGPGGSRRFRRAVFDHRSNQRVDVSPETVTADAILVFDGVFLQRPELSDSWDVRVWVDAPFNLTVPRAVGRDAAEADETAAVRAKYEKRYVSGQLMYLERFRPRDAADIVVDNSDLRNPHALHRRFGSAT